MPIRIREYRPEDFNDLWRLDQQCFPPGISYSRFELMYYMKRRDAFTMVADDGDAAIRGFVVAESRVRIRRRSEGESARQAGHIITIDVDQSARRSGVGSLLMDAAELRLQAAGCDVVYLETAVDNLPAITFYKRRGYSVLSTIPRYYDGRLDALVMGKKLRQRDPQRAGKSE